MLALTVGAVGIGSPAGTVSSTVAAAHVAPADTWPEALMSPPAVDWSSLRLQAPRGYDTVAAREARAAAEAQAAAEAKAAADAQASAAASASAKGAATPRTPRSTARSAAPHATAGPAGPAPVRLPLGADATSSDQVVTVVAASSRATSAQLTAWQRGPSGWTAVLGPVTARIGSAGVGQASESTTRTPAGTFTLTEAFGRAGDPGTALPYRVVDSTDWWVSDVNSNLYNQHVQCPPTCGFDQSVSENLYAQPAYQYAVVIDYNRGGTPGAGSAFFLHVSNGAPTAGCVAIGADNLVTLLRWLNPGARPVIAIGVG